MVVSARAVMLSSYDGYLDKPHRQLAREFENISFEILCPKQTQAEE